MGYLKPRRGMNGLGGASDCGAGQVFYPNLTYAGITGQCATPAQAQAMIAAGQATGNLNTAAAGGDTSASSILNAVSAIFGRTQAPVYMAPSTGPDMTTVLLLGGGALVGLFFLLKD